MGAPRRVMWIVGRIAVVAVLALAAGCSSDDSDASGAPAGASSSTSAAAVAGTVRHLDPTAFAAAVAQPGVVLIDVRTPAEYAEGHLANATNIDMKAADFAARIAKLDRSASYALYCRSGVRSGQAATQMTSAGFGKVVDLAGGIVAWSAANKPVTTS